MRWSTPVARPGNGRKACRFWAICQVGRMMMMSFFFPGKMKMVHLLVVDNGLRGLGQWFSWELWLEPPLGNSPLGFIRMDTQVGCVQTSSLLVRPWMGATKPVNGSKCYNSLRICRWRPCRCDVPVVWHHQLFSQDVNGLQLKKSHQRNQIQNPVDCPVVAIIHVPVSISKNVTRILQ